MRPVRFAPLMLGLGGLALVLAAAFSQGWGNSPRGASAGDLPTPIPLPTDQGPLLDLEGDSNDEAAASWTPPLPLEAGVEAAGADLPWLTGIAGLARGVVNPPLPTPIPTPTRVPTGPIVYITFDDGPSSWTPQILDVLAKYDARATFFVIGTNALSNPSLIERQASAGHAIGNHTYGHARLTSVDKATMTAEIAWPLGRGPRACGFTDCCFRPPYGATNQVVRDVASSLGFSNWLWDVDPRDWSRPGAPAIAWHVVANVHPGAVVLMHDGGGDRSQTVAALDAILAELTARGYQFRPLPC